MHCYALLVSIVAPRLYKMHSLSRVIWLPIEILLKWLVLRVCKKCLPLLHVVIRCGVNRASQVNTHCEIIICSII